MSHENKLPREMALALVRLNRSCSAEALEQMLPKAVDAADQHRLRRGFEFQQALLALVEGEIENGAESYSIFEIVSRLGIQLQGTALRVFHGGDCCPSCFVEAADQLIKELSGATGRDASITAVAAEPADGSAPHATHH